MKIFYEECLTQLELVGNLSAKTIHHKLKERYVAVLTSPHEVHEEKKAPVSQNFGSGS